MKIFKKVTHTSPSRRQRTAIAFDKSQRIFKPAL